MISKKLLVLIPVSLAIVGGTTILGVSAVHAAAGGTDSFSGLAAAIAAKFNLNATDVQNEIISYRGQQRADMEKMRLDKLAAAGKITSGQESAILAELASLQGQSMQNIRTALTVWAKANNINIMYVMPFGRMGHGGWHKPTAAIIPTPTP